MAAFLKPYSKLIAAIIGNIIGLIVAILAARGLAHCQIPDDPGTCSVYGLSTTEIVGIVMTAINALFVHQSPANTMAAPAAAPVSAPAPTP